MNNEENTLGTPQFTAVPDEQDLVSQTMENEGVVTEEIGIETSLETEVQTTEQIVEAPQAQAPQAQAPQAQAPQAQAPQAQAPQQFMPQQEPVAFSSAPAGAEPPKGKWASLTKKTKVIILAALAGVLFLTAGGGIAYALVMNSPQMRAMNAMEKANSMKKSTTTFSLKGTVGYMLADMEITGDGKSAIDKTGTGNPLEISGVFAYSVLGQSESQDLSLVVDKDYNVTCEALGYKNKPISEIDGLKVLAGLSQTTGSDTDKANGELYAFLLKGWTPNLTNEGSKVKLTVTKDDAISMITTAQTNIKDNPDEFKRLMKATSKDAKDSDIASMVKSAVSGEMLSSAKKGLESIDTFNLVMTYEDKGATVESVAEVTIEASYSGADIKMTSEVKTVYSN